MALKEDFAKFKTDVDNLAASIETKMANPATPVEVTTGMAAIVAKLTAIDAATAETPSGTDPL